MSQRLKGLVRAVGLLMRHSSYTRESVFRCPISMSSNMPGTLSARYSSYSSIVSSQRFWHRACDSCALSRSFVRNEQYQKLLKSVSKRWQDLEYQLVTITNCISFSPSSQKVVAALLPYTAFQCLFPSRAHGFAHGPSLQPRHSSAGNYGISLVLDEILLLARALYLFFLFAPVILLAPFAFYFDIGRASWMNLIRNTLESAGPAFIKWGQWSATRHDLFPQDLCESLEKLQTSAPSHSGALSRRTIEGALNLPLDKLFDEFDDLPVASGSIAQIHRATLSVQGAKLAGLKPGTVVAVKVRHPGVTAVMTQDFALMERIARICSQVPSLSELRLEESIRQFGGPLKEQLDLSVEAQHLSRFKHNFRMWRQVAFPTPLYPLISADVLVESFEEGDLISHYVNTPGGKYNEHLAQTGTDIYMQMLLKDNFIHADLHPGNILVKFMPKQQRGVMGWLEHWLDRQPRVVLLDTGMIAELTDYDRQSLISFFRALTKLDGEALGLAMLNMSEQHTCKDQKAFLRAMKQQFDKLDLETLHKNTADVMREMIEELRRHHVTLRPTVSTVVVTTMVLEGWSSKLHPEIRILEKVKDLVTVDWSDRISRTVDKLMATGSLALN